MNVTVLKIFFIRIKNYFYTVNDLQLILYIIVALIWVVARNYKKVEQTRPTVNRPAPGIPNEPKQTSYAPPLPAPAPSPSPSEKIPWKPLKIEKSQFRRSPVKRFEPSPRKIKNETKNGKDEAASVKNFFETEAANSSAAESILEKENNARLDYVTKIDFNLRQAILFSEILKRPYC